MDGVSACMNEDASGRNRRARNDSLFQSVEKQKDYGKRSCLLCVGTELRAERHRTFYDIFLKVYKHAQIEGSENP